MHGTNSLFFQILQLVYINLKFEKGTSFRAEPPSIGHYREYLPPPRPIPELFADICTIEVSFIFIFACPHLQGFRQLEDLAQGKMFKQTLIKYLRHFIF